MRRPPGIGPLLALAPLFLLLLLAGGRPAAAGGSGTKGKKFFDFGTRALPCAAPWVCMGVVRTHSTGSTGLPGSTGILLGGRSFAAVS
jgi:hypothetical protein